MRCSMTFWSCAATGIDMHSMWCWQHCQWHHCICLVTMIEMRWNMTFLVISCHWHWCWHRMMASALSKEPLHSLHNQNEEQHEITWLFGHVTQLPLPLASHDAIGVGVTHCHWHQCQCHIELTVSYMAHYIFRLRWWKWAAAWPFW